MLLRLNKTVQDRSEAHGVVSELRRQHFNKGNTLQSHNDLMMFKHQIFKYNKNIEIDTVLLDRQVAKLVKQFLSVSPVPGTRANPKEPIMHDKRNLLPIYLSEPVFKHLTTSVNISFYYYNNFEQQGSRNKENRFYNSKAQYYVPLINRLMNALCGQGELRSLASVLENFYGKQVIIEPKKVKYVHNNTDIFAKFIANKVEKNALFIKRVGRDLKRSLPIIADDIAAIDYNVKLMDLAQSRISRATQQLQDSLTTQLDLSKVYESDYDEIAKSLVMFKYLVGVQIVGKGRSAVHAAIARAQAYKMSRGTFRNKVFDSKILGNRYDLNHLQSNISESNSTIVGKYGKFNIFLKTNCL